MAMAQPETDTIGAFKGQPWILFDTVAANNFLIGGDGTDAGNAIGTNTPAIMQDGTMIFFNSPGRNKTTWPTLSNMDTQGILSYGMEVWAIAVEIKTPLFLANNPMPQAWKLAESIMQYSVVELNLGQEEQSAWPLTAFGNGGGLWTFGATVQNSEPELTATLKLPEAIYMGRTQNVNVKIKIAPFMFAELGSVTAPGVGAALGPYTFTPFGSDTPVNVPESPFGVQVKLIGRRVKDTQYGASPT